MVVEPCPRTHPLSVSKGPSLCCLDVAYSSLSCLPCQPKFRLGPPHFSSLAIGYHLAGKGRWVLIFPKAGRLSLRLHPSYKNLTVDDNYSLHLPVLLVKSSYPGLCLAGLATYLR